MRLRILRGACALVAAAVFCEVPVAQALDPLVEVGGGGPAATDCQATFKANASLPAARPKRVRCVDGNPNCDADATVNGVCTLQVAVCANSTFDAGHCVSNGVDAISVAHAQDNGDKEFDPAFLSLQTSIDTEIVPPTSTSDVCTTPVNVRVRIVGPIGNNHCHPNTKKVRLGTTPSMPGDLVDSDLLKLTCVPADPNSDGCDPMTLFTGTFDRIQRQGFDQSCAVSGCHDSNSFAGGLLLESGSSYSDLVGHDPENGVALGLGWKRVTANDTDTSLLYHKINNLLNGVCTANSLSAGCLGLRMPRPPGRPMLHPTLREIIRLWIVDGAPPTGWVAGTF